MDNKFRDNFNYLVAFLAVLISLGIFKDFAATQHLPLFGFEFTYLQLALPFILFIALAVYLGALAIFSQSINFKFFPLARFLEVASYIFAALGLLYPVGAGFAIGVSYLVQSLPPIEHWGNTFFAGFAAAQAVALLLFTKNYVSAKLQDKVDITLRNLRELTHVDTTPIDTKNISPYEIVMLYHQFVSIAKSLLALKGYGVAGEDIHRIGETLSKLGFINQVDVKNIVKVRTIRNKLVHPDIPVSKKDLRETQALLEDLVGKLKKLIINLDR